MAMTANIHYVDKVEARNSDGIAWLTLRNKNNDSVSIFMPLAQAETMVSAFNAYGQDPAEATE